MKIYSTEQKLKHAFSRNDPFAFGYQKVLNFLPPCSCGGYPTFVGFTEWPLGEGFKRGKILMCSNFGRAYWNPIEETANCCQMKVCDIEAADVLCRWVGRVHYELQSDSETIQREMVKYAELFSHLEPDRIFPYGFGFDERQEPLFRRSDERSYRR